VLLSWTNTQASNCKHKNKKQNVRPTEQNSRASIEARCIKDRWIKDSSTPPPVKGKALAQKFMQVPHPFCDSILLETQDGTALEMLKQFLVNSSVV
jgi:hypothetical protein